MEIFSTEVNLHTNVSHSHTDFWTIFLPQTHHNPLCLVLLLITFQCELNKQLLQFFIAVINAKLLKTTDRKKKDMNVLINSSFISDINVIYVIFSKMWCVNGANNLSILLFLQSKSERARQINLLCWKTSNPYMSSKPIIEEHLLE